MAERLPAQPMTRIVCVVHRLYARAVTETLGTLGAYPTLAEMARCVRQRVHARRWGLPGHATRLDDSPMEVFCTSVPSATADSVMNQLADIAELRVPGHGMLYAQDIAQYALFDPPRPQTAPHEPTVMPQDMALLTCILSSVGSGQNWAAAALSMGAGVPIVSRGEGTGIRDRLGLIRIAIPPEKEVVRLLVPAHDADTLRNLLIEETRMNRPGGGFLYQTPIRAGLADPLLRIGRQQHAASMEQVIAVLDEIKAGTDWRKRFAIDTKPSASVRRRTCEPHREIVFVCAEGASEIFSNAAMEAGARGITTTRARCLCPPPGEAGSSAREIGITLVETSRASVVLKTLCETIARSGDPSVLLQVLDAPAVFTHQ